MQPRKLGDFLFVSTLLVSSTLAAILLMPIVYGTFSVYGFLSGDDPIPQTGGFGLALVSAALAAVVLWFGGQSVSRGKTDTNTEHGVSRFRRLAPMSIGLALFLA
ncbi:MAG: hypothetical protein FJ317_02965, partial [SAR202 cluster bacterium]|nr:hypothetical protein [SAR202 cluster bacterium]